MENVLKKQLYQLSEDYILKRIHNAEKAMKAAQDAANDDTKSSAGDKFETTRAMMHMEIEKNGKQLEEAFKIQNQLKQIKIKDCEIVEESALVKTDKGTFFFCISLGKLIHENQTYFVLSLFSPLGVLFNKKRVGDQVNFNGQHYMILSVE